MSRLPQVAGIGNAGTRWLPARSLRDRTPAIANPLKQEPTVIGNAISGPVHYAG